MFHYFYLFRPYFFWLCSVWSYFSHRCFFCFHSIVSDDDPQYGLLYACWLSAIICSPISFRSSFSSILKAFFFHKLLHISKPGELDMFEISNECPQMPRNSKKQSFRITYAVNSELKELKKRCLRCMHACTLCSPVWLSSARYSFLYSPSISCKWNYL